MIANGLGSDHMCLEQSDDFEVVATVEANAMLRDLSQKRSNHPHFASTEELLAYADTDAAICNPAVLSIGSGANQSDVATLIKPLVTRLMPTVVLIAMATTPMQTGFDSNANPQVQMEHTLHQMGYAVESRSTNAAEHGGFTAQARTYTLAHRHDAKQSFKWPETANKYTGTYCLEHESCRRRTVV